MNNIGIISLHNTFHNNEIAARTHKMCLSYIGFMTPFSSILKGKCNLQILIRQCELALQTQFFTPYEETSKPLFNEKIYGISAIIYISSENKREKNIWPNTSNIKHGTKITIKTFLTIYEGQLKNS